MNYKTTDGTDLPAKRLKMMQNNMFTMVGELMEFFIALICGGGYGDDNTAVYSTYSASS
jgi:hypothetical protein